MPFSLDVDPGRALVLLRPDAPPSLQDWIDAIDRALAHPDYLSGFNFVSDRRHIVDPPSKEYVRGSIEALVARRERLGPECRVAVVTSHDAPFGMARMAEAYAEPRAVEFRGFRDYDAAIAWATGRED